MSTLPNARIAVPIDYPESDDEPMGETDFHIHELMAVHEILQDRYRDQADVYVASDLFLYYEEGNPSAVFAPDVMVVFGVPKHLRRVYKLWEEGVAPAVVIEITSRQTRLRDLGEKRTVCAMLGVAEYYLFDPESDYLKPPLQGYRLLGEDYQRLEPGADGSLASEELGLILRPEGGRLQLYDRATGERLLRPEEAYRAAREAEARAAAAEAELARLRGELEKGTS